MGQCMARRSKRCWRDASGGVAERVRRVAGTGLGGTMAVAGRRFRRRPSVRRRGIFVYHHLNESPVLFFCQAPVEHEPIGQSIYYIPTPLSHAPSLARLTLPPSVALLALPTTAHLGRRRQQLCLPPTATAPFVLGLRTVFPVLIIYRRPCFRSCAPPLPTVCPLPCPSDATTSTTLHHAFPTDPQRPQGLHKQHQSSQLPQSRPPAVSHTSSSLSRPTRCSTRPIRSRSRPLIPRVAQLSRSQSTFHIFFSRRVSPPLSQALQFFLPASLFRFCRECPDNQGCRRSQCHWSKEKFGHQRHDSRARSDQHGKRQTEKAAQCGQRHQWTR